MATISLEKKQIVAAVTLKFCKQMELCVENWQCGSLAYSLYFQYLNTSIIFLSFQIFNLVFFFALISLHKCVYNILTKIINHTFEQQVVYESITTLV